MAFDLRKLLGLDAPHAQPHAAAQAQPRNSQPMQAPVHPQIAAQLAQTHQLGATGNPLMFANRPGHQYEDDSLVQGQQGFVPLNADVAHFQGYQNPQVGSNFRLAQGFYGVGRNAAQGSGVQVQPSWDDPNDIYRSNRY